MQKKKKIETRTKLKQDVLFFKESGNEGSLEGGGEEE